MKIRMRNEPEAIEEAKRRAAKIWAKAACRFAFYFPGVKLAGVSIASPRYETVMENYPFSILGVYDPNCSFSVIEEDIECYYAEYAAMREKRNAEELARASKVIPVFCSYGHEKRKVA